MTSSHTDPTGMGRAHSSMLGYTKTLSGSAGWKVPVTVPARLGAAVPGRPAGPPRLCAAPPLGRRRPFQRLPCLPSLLHAHPALHKGHRLLCPELGSLSTTRAGRGDQPSQNQAPSSSRGRPGPRGGGLPHSSDSAWVGGAEPGGRSAGCSRPLPVPLLAVALSWRANACWAWAVPQRCPQRKALPA